MNRAISLEIRPQHSECFGEDFGRVSRPPREPLYEVRSRDMKPPTGSMRALPSGGVAEGVLEDD